CARPKLWRRGQLGISCDEPQQKQQQQQQHQQQQQQQELSRGTPGSQLFAEQVSHFRHCGHVTLRGLLGAEQVLALRQAVQSAKALKELSAKRHALRTALGMSWSEVSKTSTAEVEYLFDEQLRAGRGVSSFMQYFNLWRDSDAIRQIALSLGPAVSELLGSRRVQLYGDALFVKRPGDNGTDWHTDMEHVPLETDSFLTLWIPLQPVPAAEEGGSPLFFAGGSHLWTDAESHGAIDAGVLSVQCSGMLGLGDVSAHHGRTMHAAPELGEGVVEERWALALSYFASGALRASLAGQKQDQRHRRHGEIQDDSAASAAGNEEEKEEEDEERDSYQDWADDIPVGAEARHALLPEVPVAGDAFLLPQGAGLSTGPRPVEADLPGSWLIAKYKALLLQDWERLSEAEPLWLEALQGQRQHLGPRHRASLETATAYAQVLTELGRLDEAEALLREVISVSLRELGSWHRATLLSASALASLCEARGGPSLAEAEMLRRAVLEGFEAELGPQHPDTQDAE
ncbi:unnamed protein product, partial [Polarella glacialis]